MNLIRIPFLAMAILASCFTSRASAADTVRVAQVPFITTGPYLVAREKGYFKKVGIEVVTRIFDDGALAIPAIIAGEIDVSTMPASAGLFNAVTKGAPMVLLLDGGRDSRERAFTTISVTNAMSDAGVKSPADFAKLKGKRIGVPATGSINQYGIAVALEKAGLDPSKDVTWVSGVSQPDLMKMLGQNTIDAAAISRPFSFFAQNNKIARTVATGGDIGPDQQITTLGARKDFLTKNRDVMVRFAMAYMRGVQDFNAAAADPKAYPEVVKILSENTVINKPELVTALAPNWSYISPDAVPNVDSVMAMQDFWSNSRFGLVKTKVSREQLFDLSIAKDAYARLLKDKPFD